MKRNIILLSIVLLLGYFTYLEVFTGGELFISILIMGILDEIVCIKIPNGSI